AARIEPEALVQRAVDPAAEHVAGLGRGRGVAAQGRAPEDLLGLLAEGGADPLEATAGADDLLRGRRGRLGLRLAGDEALHQRGERPGGALAGLAHGDELA